MELSPLLDELAQYSFARLDEGRAEARSRGIDVKRSSMAGAVEGASEQFARRLLGEGIVVAPGSFLGPAGEGYVRMALVTTMAECDHAASILEAAL